jgi:pantoate--beta-alanine ligase
MKTFENIANWIRYKNDAELRKNETVGFVPTMGALHTGHLELVKKSKSENSKTAVSIFINPTQFNNAEDLLKYPRDLNRDLKLLENEGVDFVLTPQAPQIYADKYNFKVSESEISTILCGKYREGHFQGVLTVVLKLLNLVEPTNCYMGEKDYQQFLLIRDMAKSFFLNTNIVPCPTVREDSGLAKSSRNERLSPEGKLKAALIYKTLSEAKNTNDATQILTDNGFRVEYLEEHYGRRFVAAYLEDIRLIDNVEI